MKPRSGASYQLFAPLRAEKYLALKADIEKRGVMVPVEVDENGEVLDGHHRMQIAEELGIECPTIRRRFGTESEKREHVLKLNLLRRHLDPVSWAEAFARLLDERGVERGQGSSAAKRHSQSATLADIATEFGIAERTARHRLSLLDISEPDRESVRSGEMSVSQALRQTMRKPHVSHNTGDHERYTPETYADAARRTMGGIDLDPASSPQANEVIRADRYFTAETNGLSRRWGGRVWLNPPYGTDLIGPFVEKLVTEVQDGNVRSACVLVNNATETVWFQALLSVASAVCFPRGRVRFWCPGKKSAAPLQGQAVIYLGGHTRRFHSSFSGFGSVLPCSCGTPLGDDHDADVRPCRHEGER